MKMKQCKFLHKSNNENVNAVQLPSTVGKKFTH